MERWDCSECETLLGFVENKKIVRIKRKDLFVEVEGGRVSRPCTKCGKMNTLVDSNFKGSSGEMKTENGKEVR